MEKEEREGEKPTTTKSFNFLLKNTPGHQNSKIGVEKDIQKNQQLEHEFSKNEINFIKPEGLNSCLNFFTNTCMHANRTERNVLSKDGYKKQLEISEI